MKFVSLRAQEGYYTLSEVLFWLNVSKEPTRYEVRQDIVGDLLNTKTKFESYQKLGCGRTSYGVGEYILCCTKEVWPPHFWIGYP